MMRFLHAADIHLDSSLKGLPEYDGAPVEARQLATRRALENLVQLAIDQKVHFLLIAGDVYDGDWTDYNTGLYFVSQMVRLREAGIRVYTISGNHDAASRMTRSLRLPDNVRTLSTQECETVVLEDLGVAIHGRGFHQQAEYDNLALCYQPPIRGMFNIGMLHTSLTGAEGHEPYAPCTIEDLRAKQYDYWALGHIHHRDDYSWRDPAIIFPGNLQGRHFREDGPKGCVLVEVDDRLQAQWQFHPLDVFRWYECTVDIEGADCTDDVLEKAQAEFKDLLAQEPTLPLAVRVLARGRCSVHQQLQAECDKLVQELRSVALDLGGGRVWLESLRVKSTPDLAAGRMEDREGPLGELLQYLGGLRSDSDQLLRLAAELDSLCRKLPDEITDSLKLQNPAVLEEILGEVEPLLVRRLLEEDAS